MNTNNGVEAQNRLLKHNYLSRQKNLTLSSLLSTLIEHFLPDMYEKYAREQFQMTCAYRQYYSWVPAFLHQRPRSVIAHTMQRIKSCEKEGYTDVDIETVNNEQGEFRVKTRSGHIYNVNFGVSSGSPSCTCKDWVMHRLPCKHFFAIFQLKPTWNWEKLPNTYINSPRMSFDKEAINTTNENAPVDSEYGFVSEFMVHEFENGNTSSRYNGETTEDDLQCRTSYEVGTCT